MVHILVQCFHVYNELMYHGTYNIVHYMDTFIIVLRSDLIQSENQKTVEDDLKLIIKCI